SLHRPPPRSTPFPYTTLFRSVEAHHGEHRSVGDAFVERLLDTLAEGVAIGQVRQPVMPGHMRDSRLRPLLVGNVLEGRDPAASRSEEHTSELQSRENLVCRLL